MADIKKNEEKAPVAATPEKSTEDLVRAVTRAVAEELIPAVAAATASTRPAPAPARQARSGVCTTCRQRLSACHNEHEDIVVYPTKYEEFGEFFVGVILNGVRYLSNDASHKVTVPKCAVSDILNIVKNFENNERDTRMGRKAQHNSGNARSPNPAISGWR